MNVRRRTFLVKLLKVTRDVGLVFSFVMIIRLIRGNEVAIGYYIVWAFFVVAIFAVFFLSPKLERIALDHIESSSMGEELYYAKQVAERIQRENTGS